MRNISLSNIAHGALLLQPFKFSNEPGYYHRGSAREAAQTSLLHLATTTTDLRKRLFHLGSRQKLLFHHASERSRLHMRNITLSNIAHGVLLLQPFKFSNETCYYHRGSAREAVSLRRTPEAGLPSSPSERSNAYKCGTSLSHAGGALLFQPSKFSTSLLHFATTTTDLLKRLFRLGSRQLLFHHPFERSNAYGTSLSLT